MTPRHVRYGQWQAAGLRSLGRGRAGSSQPVDERIGEGVERSWRQDNTCVIALEIKRLVVARLVAVAADPRGSVLRRRKAVRPQLTAADGAALFPLGIGLVFHRVSIGAVHDNSVSQSRSQPPAARGCAQRTDLRTSRLRTTRFDQQLHRDAHSGVSSMAQRRCWWIGAPSATPRRDRFRGGLAGHGSIYACAAHLSWLTRAS